MSDSLSALEAYDEHLPMIKTHMANVVTFLQEAASLNTGHLPTIYAIKSRIKNRGHLAQKIERKKGEKMVNINAENLLEQVTDLAGVRILHMYQNQFGDIHKFIMSLVEKGELRLKEKPIAYTWDPESKEYFESFGFEPNIKPSYYTSIHYLLQPANRNNNVCCEVQVRTLFEEIWGEIDHSLNYPNPTENLACKEQLRVLAKLVSTGSRLADSIFKLQNHPNQC
jgi:putative GTP pyrophosphokinase